MTLKDIQHLLQPIRNRIFMLVGKAIIKSTDDDEDTQTAKIEVFKDELLELVERYSPYGFEARPKAEAEAIVNFINGNHDQGIITTIHDRRYRPKLNEGEVQVYDHLGSKIHLKDDNSIYIESKSGSTVDLKADGSIYIESDSGNKFDLKAAGTFQLEDANGNIIKTTATQIDFNGNLTVDI